MIVCRQSEARVQQAVGYRHAHFSQLDPADRRLISHDETSLFRAAGQQTARIIKFKRLW